MSSSIEEQFDPPEWATREEVIKTARHYINYWKIEARQRNAQWLEAIKPRPPAWQPIKTAPKDGTWVLLATNTPDPISGIPELDSWFPNVAMGRYVKEEHYVRGWMRCSEYSVNITPTHWMPLPTPPAHDSRS